MNQEYSYPFKPIVVYFNIRGNAQIIRSVLFEIGIEFDEVYVDKSPQLYSQLATKFNLQTERLPYLIHNGTAMNDVFPIIKYLCIIFNREDLLGKTVQDKIKIVQVLVKYSKERNVIYSTLLQGLRQIHEKKLGEAGLEKLAYVLASIVMKNKYCQATEKMFLQTGQFLCGYLTILDFIFYEKCFYYVNMLTIKYSPKGQITKHFVQFYQKTEFFLNNKQRLNKYKIFIEEMGEMNDLIKKMWIGDPSFLQQSILQTKVF